MPRLIRVGMGWEEINSFLICWMSGYVDNEFSDEKGS